MAARLYRACPKCGCARFHIPSQRCGQCGYAKTAGALVTPRQSSALDKMAAAHGFANGSALLADVASCTVAELGRKSRPVVQMFIGQAFKRYGA